MLLFIGRRFALVVLTMIIVSLLLFILLELQPGSVATKVLGPYSSEEQRHLWLEANGYLEPLWARYLDWLGGMVTGDFGESVRFKTPVADILWPRLWNTAILAFWTFAILIPLSLTMGVLAGMREGSALDRAISITSIITTSIPEFASAVFLSAL
ncbi:MAG: ABC transporter permease, partial [Alphaproteobacteria bacterium]|nr:ABC transporter permease [Alphaproteobacteria bacterium]